VIGLQPSMPVVTDNLRHVRERVSQVSVGAGRSPEDVRLLAATKQVSPAVVSRIIEQGIRLIGENRIQEAVSKIPAVEARDQAVWHFIGHLQTNKASQAVDLFSTVQSLDSTRLAESLGRAASRRGRPVDVLLEINTSGESSKQGFRVDDIYVAAEAALATEWLRPAGLMTIGPLTGDVHAVRASFRMLATLRDRLAARYTESEWGLLSMGMSDDYEIAIQEGSTLIRLGRALFGPRG